VARWLTGIWGTTGYVCGRNSKVHASHGPDCGRLLKETVVSVYLLLLCTETHVLLCFTELGCDAATAGKDAAIGITWSCWI